jgi:Asp-tRNA(Asn)/Glu-tRNA(Gln) amidotransferase A subunit family amidase
MIRLPQERATDYRAVERSIAETKNVDALRSFYDDFIRRYEDLDRQFLFTASFDRDYVHEQLDTAWSMRDRELFAIPFGVKDVFNTKTLPTSMGSEIWRGFTAGNNARVVDEIADRGGIVFSKTTTAEFAVHYIQAGRTLNPHNAAHITGTSSAGSAVAVACGALPVCLGTQTAGSIVRPASFCGAFGFKPSFGAFDRTGTLKTTDTLDTIGLLGSDIYGLRKSFLASFQKDPQYPLAKNYFDRLRAYQRREDVRVGLITDQFARYGDYDAEVQSAFASVVDCLAESNIAASPVRDIDFINRIHPLHQRIYCKALSYYFQQELQHETAMSDVMREMIRLGNEVSTAEYVEALQAQPGYRTAFDKAFADYDFLITPSTASVAPRIGGKERDDTCLIWTFLGYPALSIPAFWSDANGLPFGLQIVAPKFCDLPLLDFGQRVVTLLRDASKRRA